MKHLLPFLLCLLITEFSAHSQTRDTVFSKQWQLIDSLIAENSLPKTAMAKVNNIYEEAKRRNMPAQVIKALLYKVSLQDKTMEKDVNGVVDDWDKEIANTSNDVQKSILYVLNAETLKNYYNNNRWDINHRSKTTNFKKADITTWSTDDFYTSINVNYTKALEPATLLQQTSLSQYTAIIIEGNSPNLRPTMYDLVANIALDYYKTAPEDQTQAENAFTLNNEAALSAADDFVAYKFISQDSTSRLLKALQLYQQVVKFHAKHNDTAALIDIDIDRLEWVYANAAFSNKDAYHKAALEAITKKYTNHPQAAQAWYLLINMIAGKAGSYKPFADTAHRYDFVIVKRMIEERLNAQPAKSDGNSNMHELLAQIATKELQTQAESVNVPSQPFRILVQYKNVDTLYGRVIRKSLLEKLRNKNGSDFWKQVSKLPYITSWAQALPQTNDYQQHKVEIKMDELPAGEYVLLGSNSNGFVDSTSRLLTQDIIVSHLSYIHKGNDYFVLDRESGKPLKGIKANIMLRYYNNGWTDKVLPGKITTQQGYFTLAGIKDVNNGQVFIQLIDHNDTLNFGGSHEYLSIGSNNESNTLGNLEYERKNTVVNFYTDRAIYRPGQKVFFKGIAITKDAVTYKPKLFIPTDSIRAYLRDVNDKNIDSVSLKINEFGSLAGSFLLPVNTLTGQFSIVLKDLEGWQRFRVEEYKRPTYYVQLDTLKSAYRLKDTITVTGFAQAFAGNFLNNAQVKYNVQRRTRYIIYDWGYRRFPGNNNIKQIAEGTVTTDGGGKFTIRFPAQPDETVDTTTNPIFDFTINTTVTDAGGETREANTSLSVGYVSLTVKVDLPSIIERFALTKIPVSVENLSGRPVDANVHINVYPLLSPGKAVRKRYWDRPDMFAMSKEEFVKYFPYDEYENESDEHTWLKEAAIVNDTFSTALLKAYTLPRVAFQQGWYAIEATTTDKDGHEVKTIAYTEVYDAESASVPAGDADFNTPLKTIVHPNEKASLLVGSGFDNVYVLQQTDNPSQSNKIGGGLQSYKTFTINNGKTRIEEPVTEDNRGGFGIYWAFVKHNRFYTHGTAFNVPYDNKELNVKYTTYRNKTEPGSKEQWTVQVTGNDSTKKAAELMTSMYDASLDQFAVNDWSVPDIWPAYENYSMWSEGAGFSSSSSSENDNNNPYIDFYYYTTYDMLATRAESLWFEENDATSINIGGIHLREQKGMLNDVVVIGYGTSRKKELTGAVPVVGNKAMTEFETFAANSESSSDTVKFNIETQRAISSPEQNTFPQIRTNFNETAFFFPQLYPDSAGNYTLQFTMPESLTKWKWMSLAHTKDLSFGTNEETIITQKTLMVQPGIPRFLREGDRLELVARISNMGDSALTGQVELQLVDAQTNNPVDGLFQNVFPNQYFTSEAGQTSVVKFPVVIPFNYNKPLTYRIVAKTNSFSDGEENTLPVLTNRMLVTESLPLYIKGDTTQHFTFDKLLNNKSETLQTQSLTVEYTANPIWNAVQALPYLIEYPYECAEQTFNRFYANALAAYIVQQHPRIKQVFEAWLKASPTGEGLVGALEKNQELKQVLLEETPWMFDAQNETQQRKNIALLFDMVKMSNDAKSALQKLQDMQVAEGGFAWFKGGYPDRYITQYILTGIGRLQELHAVPSENAAMLNSIVSNALGYLDNEANKDYNELVKDKVNLNNDNLGQVQIQYLFMRSYFTTVAISNKTAYNYYYQQAMKYWQHQSEYMKGMIVLALLRTNQQAFVMDKIYPSIVENAVTTKDKGMYWKDSQWGYYWYQSPIEQQALLIELAETIKKQTDADEMKTWLINQKQTTNWKTTKATADACFALLLHSDSQLDADRKVTIQLGDYTINNGDEQAVAGTGYFKKVLDETKVAPGMGNITVSVQTQGTIKNTSPSYGSVYWQYFEDMDKITQATTSLSLHKKLFIERNTAAGKILTPVNDDSVLHTGDKVIVRMELKTDRDLEYIHLKDMRAASMEPVNVLSEYKWQDGLGYYESTKDVATDFFISYIPKGSYVFEYPVYITHVGTFSAGIATVQCMYAPEFTSHAEGLKIVVE